MAGTGRRAVDRWVIPALGLPLTVGALFLVSGPWSWFSFYGSWLSEGGALGSLPVGFGCLVLGTVAWAITWLATRGHRARVRIPLLLVAVLLAPALLSWWELDAARTRWCEIRSVNGPDPRLHTITGPLAPHCTPADRIHELSS